MVIIDSCVIFKIARIYIRRRGFGTLQTMSVCFWDHLEDQLALGSGGTFCPVSFSCPGIGMFFIVSRTSVPDSKEIFVRRTMKATAVKRRKSLRIPRSKAAMATRGGNSARLYKPEEHY
jgi:hypothetical protein